MVDVHIISESVGIKKPAPRIFEIALQELRLDASECWFLGDHPENDVLGASAAGLCGVWFRASTPWPDGSPPAVSVSSFAEFEALVRAARD